MIRLKEPREKEILQTYTWLQHSEFQKLFMLSTVPTWEQHLNFFKKLSTDTTQKFFCIYNDDTHIGNCGLKYLHTHQPDIYIYIGDNKNKHRGYGYEACKELIKYVQVQYNFLRIKVHVLKTNTPAINLYKKLGFVFSSPTDFDLAVWKERIELVHTMVLKINTAST